MFISKTLIKLINKFYVEYHKIGFFGQLLLQIIVRHFQSYFNFNWKTFPLSCKPCMTDDLQFKLPKLCINQTMQRVSYKKFLWILLNENLSWKKHLRNSENKVAKRIGLMHQAKPFLDKTSLLSLFV